MEAGSVSEEIEEHTYEFKILRGQEFMVEIFHPSQACRLKELELQSGKVELALDPVADTVATATFQGAEVDWYIKAEDIVLKKGAAMNPQTPKKDAPPTK